MFVRVSTYRPAPGSTGAPSDETVRKVLALPGCRGIYYLLGKDDKSLSLTLWEDKSSLDASSEAADSIRDKTTAQQHMDVLAVEEYEVLTRELKQ
jgi:hypothetical protein